MVSHDFYESFRSNWTTDTFAFKYLGYCHFLYFSDYRDDL